MADEEQSKAPRRFRKVETVREKAEKQAAGGSEEKHGVRHGLWRGFTWPVRIIWRGLAKLTHMPPLKQIGHGFRWFADLKPVRFLAKILLIMYVINSWRELKQVTWPTRRESRRLTTAVVLFAIVFGFLIAVVDYGLDKLFKEVLLK
ncbi:MAG TPA: preprotein translocase subunit SecE [Candidatus Saccharimonadales bacterium]